MSSDAVIEAENIGKRYEMYGKPSHRLWQILLGNKRALYREFWALKNVSFDVKRGESVGIIGRNGAGKSTLLQIISGTLTPTCGTVRVKGRIAALLELGSGFNPEFTGRENVYMNATIYGLSRQEIDGKFDDMVAFADIGDYIDQPLKTYSSGMMVRLAFSVSAFMNPDILIIDEALSVGDVFFQLKCHAHMEKLKHDGTTLLFVTHDLASTEKYCQRTMLLDQGNMLFFGETKRAILQYYLLNRKQRNKSIEIKSRDEALSNNIPTNLTKESVIINYGKNAQIKAFHSSSDKAGEQLFYTGSQLHIQAEFAASCHLDYPSFNITLKNAKNYIVTSLMSIKFDDNDVYVGRDSAYLVCKARLILKVAAGNYIVSVSLSDYSRHLYTKIREDECEIVEPATDVIGIEAAAIIEVLPNRRSRASFGGMFLLDHDFSMEMKL